MESFTGDEYGRSRCGEVDMALEWRNQAIEEELREEGSRYVPNVIRDN